LNKTLHTALPVERSARDLPNDGSTATCNQPSTPQNLFLPIYALPCPHRNCFSASVIRYPFFLFWPKTMSLLPQYQRLPDTQVSPGEFTSSKDTRLSFEDDDPHPPTYPPQPRAGSSTEGHPRPSVVYSFVARDPIKAHNQDVVGVLMPNRAVSGSGGKPRLAILHTALGDDVSRTVCGPGVCA
jgi:hypothetical protein